MVEDGDAGTDGIDRGVAAGVKGERNLFDIRLKTLEMAQGR